jgi:elongation factor Ts
MSDEKQNGTVGANAVKELREKTGAGMMDCKRALAETAGDFKKAEEWLRQHNLASAAKKTTRAAAEGLVESYIHMGGKLGVLLEVNCETDFVARTDDFKNLVRDVAMHIAASGPSWLKREDVPADVLQKEKEIYQAQLKEQNKPEKAWPKILEGKVEKFYQENCLLDQMFVKDTNRSVKQVVQEMIGKLGENINVRRYTRFVLGEGLEKRTDDVALEIAKAMAGKAQ